MNFKVPSNPNFSIILWNVSWRHSQDVHAMVTPTLPMLLTAGFASAYNRKCSFHWVGYGTSHLLRLRLTIFSFHFEDRQHTWGLLVACPPFAVQCHTLPAHFCNQTVHGRGRADPEPGQWGQAATRLLPTPRGTQAKSSTSMHEFYVIEAAGLCKWMCCACAITH